MTGMLPVSAGVSLKPEHYPHALAPEREPSWFEVHAENYMGNGGPSHRVLDRLRADVPLSIHGVGLSIGSADGLDPDHLARLRTVVRRFQPAMVSEHLAWSSHDGIFLNDLLPLPYNQETLDRVCSHIDLTQMQLGQEILLENPSTYLQFLGSEYSEPDFLAEISRRTGCLLLLDLNNVFVSACNQGYNAVEYLSQFPLDRVAEVHLAGHTVETSEAGHSVLIDSHDCAVCDAVWGLYCDTLNRTGPLPTLIEWDANIPEWQMLVQQAERANRYLASLEADPEYALPG